MRKFKPFIYLMAVDGDYEYYAETTRTITAAEFGETLSGRLPARLVRLQLSTGTKTTLLTTTRSLLYNVAAENGRVAVSVIKLGVSRKSLSIDTQLLTALHTDAALTTASSLGGRINEKEETFCGGAQLLGGLSDKGELLAVDVNGDCKHEAAVTADLVGIAPDGTKRVLQDNLDEDVSYLDQAQLNSNLLLSSGPFGESISAQNVETKEIKRYWEGGNGATVDQGRDGSVATVPNNDEWLLGIIDVRGRPSSKGDLIVFPQGNPDNPVIASSTSGLTTSVKFCGAYLYELRRVPARSRREIDPRRTIDYLVGQPSKFEVILRHSSGEYIKSLGATPSMLVQARGCNGDRLELSSSHDTKAVVRSYGP